MAQGKSEQEIMMIAKNVCAEKGIDFDSAMENFKNMMKGM